MGAGFAVLYKVSCNIFKMESAKNFQETTGDVAVPLKYYYQRTPRVKQVPGFTGALKYTSKNKISTIRTV